MSNNITKTIKESVPLEFEEQFFVGGVRDYMFEGEPLSARAGEAIKKFLLQSQIRLIDAVIEEMRSYRVEVPEVVKLGLNNMNEWVNSLLMHAGRINFNKALEDQISSLEEVKKSLIDI